ncbi:Modification methylase HhaI [Halioglobus japonicus]|nr:Modification methylase HhaI [Halioglobus japonicus]
MKSFAEFFAGVGLVREGLNVSEWECNFANDISTSKQETYLDNFGSDDFFLGDIWDIASEPNLVPNDTFLYTASFPCTDLSVAGGRAGLAGAESGTLNALIEILTEKKRSMKHPKVVLLENVRGFLTSHHGKDIENTVREFSKLGYFVDIIELDAIDFSAQSRPRVFMFAVEEELAKSVLFIKNDASIFDDWWSFFDSKTYLRSNRVKRIILGAPELNWGLLDVSLPERTSQRLADIVETIPLDSSLWWASDRQSHLYSQMSENHKAVLDQMVRNQTLSFGTVYRRVRKGRSMAELRTDGYAGCLRTPRGGSSKQILIQAGNGAWNVRLLTAREYARLQGVRDSFKLPENANKGYFAMGDAVCVPVIEFITKHILDAIYLSYVDSCSDEVQKVDMLALS